jgi:hypothetical protein
MMNKFYRTSDFKFSPAARQWVLDRYCSRFDQNFFHDLDITQFNKTSQEEWKTSIAGREIIGYLESLGCDCDYYGIGVFVSNTEHVSHSNPHCDVRFRDKTQSRIKTRFNTMVLGNSQDEMMWWPEFGYGDSRFTESHFTSLTGQQYTSWCIPGNDSAERWNWLGEPPVRERPLVNTSALVKTDCVHALILSPGPRLIVTVAIDQDLDQIRSI